MSDGLTVTIGFGAVDYSAQTVAGMTITERLGAADTLSIEFEDSAGEINIGTLPWLQDIEVQDPTEPIFCGQITVFGVETIHHDTEHDARKVSISAEGYERLLAGCLAFPMPDAVDEQPDGTQVAGLNLSTAGSTWDYEAVVTEIGSWWHGPVTRPLDLTTFVHATNLLYHPLDPIPLHAMPLKADIDQIAQFFSSPTVQYLIDASMRFHWFDGDPAAGQAEWAPYDISSVGFADLAGTPSRATVMTTRMKIERDYTSMVARALVTGAYSWTSGLVNNDVYPIFAGPDVQISSELATTEAKRDAFAERYFRNDTRIGVRGTATIPAGYDGWHKGQMVRVTDPGNALDGEPLLITGVTRRLVSTGDAVPAFEYDLTFGTSPRRSLARESRVPQYVVPDTTAAGFAVYCDAVSVTPDLAPALVVAQVRNAAGDPLKTSAVTLTWHLLIDGTRAASATDASAAYYLDDATGVTDSTGRAFTHVQTGAAWTASDYVDVEAEVLAP